MPRIADPEHLGGSPRVRGTRISVSLILESLAAGMAAHRFCDEVEAAIKLISTHPEIARKAGFPKALEARIWPVRRYPNYVILFRVTPTDVVFLRLLYGARDLPPLIPNE